MSDIDWRAELAKWCGMQPPVPLYFRDTSGVFPPEFYERVGEEMAKLAKEVEKE